MTGIRRHKQVVCSLKIYTFINVVIHTCTYTHMRAESTIPKCMHIKSIQACISYATIRACIHTYVHTWMHHLHWNSIYALGKNTFFSRFFQFVNCFATVCMILNSFTHKNNFPFSLIVYPVVPPMERTFPACGGEECRCASNVDARLTCPQLSQT